MFASSLISLALAGSAFATVFVTSPIASTSCSSKSPCTVSWKDDGNAPTLQQFGPAKISVYVGNAQQQTPLQLIVPSTDVSTSNSVIFTPDPTIGPNSNAYFVRFESLGFKDPANPQFPALAFSAKFTLTDMTGTFSPAVQSQIDGQTTAPLGGPTAAPAATTPVSQSNTPAPTTAKSAGSSAASSSST
ncbi:hypothetical protein BD410DRAFT_680260, partial [Rickenella mellea]